jgi:hypothetical protein
MGLLGKAARLVSGRKKEDKAGQGSSPAPSSPSYDSPGTTGDVPLSAADALTLVKGAVTKDNRKVRSAPVAVGAAARPEVFRRRARSDGLCM